MSGKPAATGCPHPAYPEYEAEFGEDPACILYHLDPRPRIRDIDSVALVRAYLDVESDREEPRNEIIAALDKRLQYFQEQRYANAREEAVNRERIRHIPLRRFVW